jgi:hypothetical protein
MLQPYDPNAETYADFIARVDAEEARMRKDTSHLDGLSRDERARAIAIKRDLEDRV